MSQRCASPPTPHPQETAATQHRPAHSPAPGAHGQCPWDPARALPRAQRVPSGVCPPCALPFSPAPHQPCRCLRFNHCPGAGKERCLLPSQGYAERRAVVTPGAAGGCCALPSTSPRHTHGHQFQPGPCATALLPRPCPARAEGGLGNGEGLASGTRSPQKQTRGESARLCVSTDSAPGRADKRAPCAGQAAWGCVPARGHPLPASRQHGTWARWRSRIPAPLPSLCLPGPEDLRGCGNPKGWWKPQGVGGLLVLVGSQCWWDSQGSQAARAVPQSPPSTHLPHPGAHPFPSTPQSQALSFRRTGGTAQSLAGSGQAPAPIPRLAAPCHTGNAWVRGCWRGLAAARWGAQGPCCCCSQRWRS